jgi:uncharacterized cupredoxin-like copper-binding protein
MACAPGGVSVSTTEVAPALQTGVAQAPTAVNRLSAAIQAGATQVAPAVNTAVPSVATAAANAASTVVPALQTAAAAAQTAVAPQVSNAQTSVAQAIVEVKLTEYKIDMPNTLRSGPFDFRVTNAGTIQHGFKIEGQGISQQIEGNLNPGETKHLLVNLVPGTYQVFCPVDGHRDQGMRVNLTVTAQ